MAPLSQKLELRKSWGGSGSDMGACVPTDEPNRWAPFPLFLRSSQLDHPFRTHLHQLAPQLK